MSKYPVVIFFRYDKYADADQKTQNLDCTVHITSTLADVEKLYSPEYHILATYGPNENEYHQDINSVICPRLRKRWIHFKTIDPPQFARGINYCFIDTVISDRNLTRPTFSVFTTCFNSFDKILRPYKSLKAQTDRDWEWVIVDDSTDQTHFAFLKDKFKHEPKIRLYNRSGNSGSIGTVKNEAISLCRGKYILELDHDDEILQDLIKDAVTGFTKYPHVDFIYMDFINIYENGKNFSYSDFLCKGYGGYYYEFYAPRKQWVKVYVTPQINNITASFLFCMPNHPRIWRREKLLEFGSYSEFLPICDDQEILLRTILKGNILKIPKLAYIQYMNDNGSNFSLIRNKEINRIGPNFITPQFKALYNLDQHIKTKKAWHDPVYISKPEKIWLRDNTFTPNYANEIYNPDATTQYGIITLAAFNKHIENIKMLAQDKYNDFLLLDNSASITSEAISTLLETNNLHRIKFYILKDTPHENLINYFERIYKSIHKTELIIV